MHGKPFAIQAFEMAWYFRKTGDVLPTWFITDKNWETQIVGTPWQNDREKRMAAQTIADIVRETKAIRLMFITDTWIRELPIDAPESERFKKPSQSIDAFEAINLQLWNADGTGFFKMRAYRQMDNGEFQILWDKEDNDPANANLSEGPFQIVLNALLKNRF